MNLFKKVFGLIIFFMVFSICLPYLKTEEKSRMKVFWGLLGSYPSETKYNPYKITRDDRSIDSGAITFAIRRDYKTIIEISAETGISRKLIERKIKELKTCGLVIEENSKFMINFPFWDKPLRDEINLLGKEITNDVYRILNESLPDLKKAFSVSSLSAQGYKWQDVSLIIVGGLLLDTGLNDRGLRRSKVFQAKNDTPVRPGNYKYWYKAVENGWGNFWKFGHNQKNYGDSWIGLFYGSKPGYKKIQRKLVWHFFDKDNADVSHILIKEGKVSRKSLSSKTGLTREKLDTVISRMEIAKSIKIEGDYITPKFPVFQQRDINEFLPTVDMICKKIIREAYLPRIGKIQVAWEKIKPKNWHMTNIDKFFLREVFDRPYNLTLDMMIEKGILPPSPVEPPFGYWGINGKFEVL